MQLMKDGTEAPQKIKNRATKWLSNPTSGYKTKGNKNQDLKETFSPIFIVLLCIRAKIWEQSMCLSMDEGIKKTWYINTHTHTHTHTHTCMCVCVLSHFSRVWLFVTLQTVVCQAPLSLGFSRQEYWSWLPCPPPRDFPDPGIELTSLMSLALIGRFFTTSTS